MAYPTQQKGAAPYGPPSCYTPMCGAPYGPPSCYTPTYGAPYCPPSCYTPMYGAPYGPPSCYTPMYGVGYQTQAPSAVWMSTMYPPQKVGQGYQQITGIIGGTGFQLAQSTQPFGPEMVEQNVVMPGTGVVVSQKMERGWVGPTGPHARVYK